MALCKIGDLPPACSDGTAPTVETAGVVHIRPGLDDAQLKIALQASADAALNNFPSLYEQRKSQIDDLEAILIMQHRYVSHHISAEINTSG